MKESIKGICNSCNKIVNANLHTDKVYFDEECDITVPNVPMYLCSECGNNVATPPEAASILAPYYAKYRTVRIKETLGYLLEKDYYKNLSIGLDISQDTLSSIYLITYYLFEILHTFFYTDVESVMVDIYKRIEMNDIILTDDIIQYISRIVHVRMIRKGKMLSREASAILLNLSLEDTKSIMN